MHRMLNLNKFKDSCQVFEKNPRLCFMRKKNSRIHKKYFLKNIWPKIFTTNTLCANVYKMYECDKNRMPYCIVKSFKKSNLWEFWATFDKFYFFQFHN